MAGFDRMASIKFLESSFPHVVVDFEDDYVTYGLILHVKCKITQATYSAKLPYDCDLDFLKVSFRRIQDQLLISRGRWLADKYRPNGSIYFSDLPRPLSVTPTNPTTPPTTQKKKRKEDYSKIEGFGEF